MHLLKRLGQFPNQQRKSHFSTLANYADGQFQNLIHTPPLAEGASTPKILWNFFKKYPHTVPAQPLPAVQTDLHNLPPEANVLVWFGHSSYFIQIDGYKLLIDPVFSGNASPIWGSVPAFPGTNDYQAAHIPPVDVLFISHDHWDHLDYNTIRQLRDKVNTVVCGLGVAQHFEYWGWDKNRLIERNWFDTVELDAGLRVTLTPARHFSGRLFQRNISLWTSFVVKTASHNLFLGGDSGYGPHFKTIGAQFGPFDLALLECGQYNHQWPYIHSFPNELIQEAQELKAAHLMPVHHSKFKLSQHPWYEPLQQVSVAAEAQGQPLVTPKIGEPVHLNALNQPWEKWWVPFMG